MTTKTNLTSLRIMPETLSSVARLLTVTVLLQCAVGSVSSLLSQSVGAAQVNSDSLTSRHSCSLDSQTNAVHCGNLSLVEVPTDLPANTKMLDLSYNQISEVAKDGLQNLLSIEVLRMQNGILSSVSRESFVNCSSLRRLYLDHNLLSTLSFVVGTHLQDLYISYNRITTVETEDEVLPLIVLDLSFNSVRHFSSRTLSVLQNVRTLNLSHNRMEAVVLDDQAIASLSRLNHLNISSNDLSTFKLCNECHMYSLEYLDLSNNKLIGVDPSWCELFPNLAVLELSGNPTADVADGTFEQCKLLQTLNLSRLLIRDIRAGTFRGLDRLRMLRLDHNKQLISLHQKSFSELLELRELYLRGCGLTSVEPGTFLSTASLTAIDLADNRWNCDCRATIVRELSMLSSRGTAVSEETYCINPSSVSGKFVLNVSSDRHECRRARPLKLQQTVWADIGADLLVACNATGDLPLSITWIWKHNWNNVRVKHLDAGVDYFSSESVGNGFEAVVLHNGSLYIGSVSRANAGVYYCIVSNEYGNGTMVVSLRLSSGIISIVTLHSIIIGLLSAVAFFLIAVVIGLARYLAYVCSRKERRKRKSIRAVLESIQDYKSAQFDRFSAYRTAKMDQLSAFKSAKIEQLSAFRDARVDRLRTYKQATVASILTHIERMREHYAAQTARIKDNCAQQAERLRERYSARRGRFKNYRSHHVDKMRENYAAQAARIREYGVVQMSRLREQYKTQQQYVLKLVELLDVGSCMSGVIEAECMKAESMIFDADIAFDFEAQPAHANESLIAAGGIDDDSDLSHYAAASDSDLSLSSEEHGMTCVADISVEVDGIVKSDVDEMAGILAVADDVLAHMTVDERDGYLVGDNLELSSSNVEQPLEKRQVEWEAAHGGPSGSVTTAETSGSCVELEAINLHPQPMEQLDDSAELDTSC